MPRRRARAVIRQQAAAAVVPTAVAARILLLHLVAIPNLIQAVTHRLLVLTLRLPLVAIPHLLPVLILPHPPELTHRRQQKAILLPHQAVIRRLPAVILEAVLRRPRLLVEIQVVQHHQRPLVIPAATLLHPVIPEVVIPHHQVYKV